METKMCSVCGEEKPLTLEFFPQGKNKRNGIEIPYWYNSCKICSNKRKAPSLRKYKEKNRKKLADSQKIYYQEHKDECSEYSKQWYEENKEEVKQRSRNYYKGNKERLKPIKNKWVSNRRVWDINFNLREKVSKRIRENLKKNGGSKNGSSILKYLPYSFQQLKDHLQQQFEPWMTWDNYGVYRLDTWKDNDPTTWTWQIDHIIPHSKFNYTSMEDQAFLDCWALTNLRPYSAKQNVIDGDRE